MKMKMKERRKKATLPGMMVSVFLVVFSEPPVRYTTGLVFFRGFTKNADTFIILLSIFHIFSVLVHLSSNLA